MRYNNQDLLNVAQQEIGIIDCGGLTLREYQLELLEIIKEIDRISKKNNIQYFFMFGSLIGAVRHRGFIPWDDDVDICMTRENYNKFVEICKNDLSDEYALETYQQNMNIGLTVPRIRKKGTTYINRFEISKHGEYAGFYVDIIILDYLSTNPRIEKTQKKTLMALHRVVCPGFSQGEVHLSFLDSACVELIKCFIGKKKMISFLERKLGSVKPKDANKVMAQYIHAGRMDFLTFDKFFFEDTWTVPFENIYVPIPQKALTLLNHNYCKRLRREGTLIETNYENEKQAILEGEFYRYDDIMYIPENRKRGTHTDIIFDSRMESSIYDSYYFTKFNKRKNDKSAIKERKYREKASKYLAILNKNEALAKMACEEIRIKEILNKYQEEKEVEVDTKKYKTYAIALNNLHVSKHLELNIEELKSVVEIFIKASYLVTAKRISGLMKMKVDSAELSIHNMYEEIIDAHLDAYYAIFETRIADLENYVEKYDVNDCYLVRVVEAFLCYEKKNYACAEKMFKEIISEDEEIFLAYYYLGKIAQKNNQIEGAIRYFKESLDATCYMPLLQMSLNELNVLL